MPTAEMIEKRIGAVRGEMARQGIDLFYVRTISDILWITGFVGVFDEETAHRLAITADAQAIHTDSRYIDAIQRAIAQGPVAWQDSTQRISHARWLAAQLDAGMTVAIEDTLPLREYRQIEGALADAGTTVNLLETDGIVVNLRAVKDEAEIASLRAAQAITDAAFTYIVGFISDNVGRPAGLTERQVQLELDERMRRLGAEGLAFPSIVASGPNGAAPHSIPGERKLQKGDLVVMDFGARAQGYCSDMTRTVCIGAPGQEEAHALATLRRANEEVEALLAPGVTGIAMHQHAEDVLAQEGFGGRMGHGLGHGVGIDIHEEPCLNLRNDAPFVPGNVVTVEPGIYIPGRFGCRLEDFGVVTSGGFVVFTQSTHELVII